ncbi:MAG: amidohydrolase [Saprospiraceae bacterium]|nr:amidohydrolase [Saprospiraceae bacterium]
MKAVFMTMLTAWLTTHCLPAQPIAEAPYSSPVNTDTMIAHFKNEAENLFGYTLGLHAHLCTHPELSWKEFETTRLLAAELDAMGIPYRILKRGTGLIAVIDCNDPDAQTVILRFDIDQLNVAEEGKKLYPSGVKGASAACGHSAHTAIGMTVAKILLPLRHQLKGRLVIMAQPAEELITDPGCKYMIEEEGILDFPNITGAFGLHVTPNYQSGDIHLAEGEFMASANEMDAVFYGKSGHVQGQKNTRNTIHAAAEFITQLNIIRSAHSDPFQPLLLACTKIHSNTWANENSNLVPDTTSCTVIFRTLSLKYLEEMTRRIRQIAQNVANSFDQQVVFKEFPGIPTVKNDPELTRWSREQLIGLLGAEHVKPADPRMGGDDVSFLSHRIRLVYLRLGSGGAPEFEFPLHDKQFQVNPACLPVGVSALAYLIYQKMAL